MMVRLFGLAVLAAPACVLASCAVGAENQTAQSISPQLTATDEDQPTPGATPQAFLDREPLRSCGEFTLAQGEMYPADALQCVEDAVGAEGSELKITGPTTEGDIVVSWFRALPSGGMEMWYDMRQDQFAGEGVAWLYNLCPTALSPMGDLGECTSEEFN